MSHNQQGPPPANTTGQVQNAIELVESVSKSPTRGPYTSLMRCNGETNATKLNWPLFGPKLHV